eukprot:3756650-Rhodomonas_salina.3
MGLAVQQALTQDLTRRMMGLAVSRPSRSSSTLWSSRSSFEAPVLWPEGPLLLWCSRAVT